MDYYSIDAMSQSKLKALKKSPYYFYKQYIARDETFFEEETEAFEFGEAFHKALLEPTKFKDLYMVCDENRRTIKGRERITEIEICGQIPISSDKMMAIKKMRENVLNKKMAYLLNQNGFIEREFFWNDIYSGISCKGKLDYWIEPCDRFKNGLILDIKTTQDASPDEFARSCYKFGYYNQAAFYSLAIKTIYPHTLMMPNFIFVAVEKNYPFDCAFYAADEEMIFLGLEENKRLLEIYKHCSETNEWDGYEDKVSQISMPQWAVNKLYALRSNTNEKY